MTATTTDATPIRFASPEEVIVASARYHITPADVAALQTLLFEHHQRPFDPEPISLMVDLHLEYVPACADDLWVANCRAYLDDFAARRHYARYLVLDRGTLPRPVWYAANGVPGRLLHDHFRTVTAARLVRRRRYQPVIYTYTKTFPYMEAVS